MVGIYNALPILNERIVRNKKNIKKTSRSLVCCAIYGRQNTPKYSCLLGVWFIDIANRYN